MQTPFDNKSWQNDFFDHAHDLIQIVHPDGTLLYVNNSWLRLMEYQQEEIQNKSLYSFIGKTDLDRYIQYRMDIIKGHINETEIIFDLISKTGKKISVEGFVSVKLKDCRPLYTMGIFRDITTRLINEAQLKHINNELNEQQKNLQLLLNNAPDAVIVINQDSYIRFWNPKAEEIFGWKSDEVINQSLSNTIIPIQYREAHEKGMQRYLKSQESLMLNKTIQITALNKAGLEFHISLTISPTLQNGKLAFIAFLRNIEAEMKSHIQLEQKSLELERINKNLEEFVYVASHDLKEPVRKVITFSERLKNRMNHKLDEDDRRFFQRLENAAFRMNTLIEDLLKYSHVSAGERLMEQIDLNDNLQMVIEDLELEIQEKNALISIETLPVIMGNNRQIHQLFHNLISNALKYHQPETCPVIHISSALKNNGHDINVSSHHIQGYMIEIKDNGIGFEPEYAKSIFNVFTRLHGNADYPGNGVGLSIARKVVENHHGYIWAESEPGKGSTFKIWLPWE